MTTKTDKKTHPSPSLSQAMADRNRLVCAGCYGELEIIQDVKQRTQALTCETEGCSCPGLVTRKYVEQAKEQNALESIEAQATVRSAVPWMPKKSQDQLLRELGF